MPDVAPVMDPCAVSWLTAQEDSMISADVNRDSPPRAQESSVAPWATG